MSVGEMSVGKDKRARSRNRILARFTGRTGANTSLPCVLSDSHIGIKVAVRRDSEAGEWTVSRNDDESDGGRDFNTVLDLGRAPRRLPHRAGEPGKVSGILRHV